MEGPDRTEDQRVGRELNMSVELECILFNKRRTAYGNHDLLPGVLRVCVDNGPVALLLSHHVEPV